MASPPKGAHTTRALHNRNLAAAGEAHMKRIDSESILKAGGTGFPLSRHETWGTPPKNVALHATAREAGSADTLITTRGHSTQHAQCHSDASTGSEARSLTRAKGWRHELPSVSLELRADPPCVNTATVTQADSPPAISAKQTIDLTAIVIPATASQPSTGRPEDYEIAIGCPNTAAPRGALDPTTPGGATSARHPKRQAIAKGYDGGHTSNASGGHVEPPDCQGITRSLSAVQTELRPGARSTLQRPGGQLTPDSPRGKPSLTATTMAKLAAGAWSPPTALRLSANQQGPHHRRP